MRAARVSSINNTHYLWKGRYNTTGISIATVYLMHQGQGQSQQCTADSSTGSTRCSVSTRCSGFECGFDCFLVNADNLSEDGDFKLRFEFEALLLQTEAVRHVLKLFAKGKGFI